MRIVTIRRICQIFFLLVFIWFCIVTTLGVQWWQLRGWPVNWILQLDPLVALGTMLSANTLTRGLLWALLTVVMSITLGRFFCGWVCPFGTVHQFVGYLGRRRKTFKTKVALNQYHRAQAIKYYLLVFLLAAASGSLLARLFKIASEAPLYFLIAVIASLAGLAVLAMLRLISDLRKVAVVVLVIVLLWFGLGLILPTEKVIVASLQTGLLDPIALIHRSVNLTLMPFVQQLSASQRYYQGA
ncbi:MAG: 4Fe-4S binding protein, partial [Deltaproteobacteria bacterium]